MKTDIIGNRYGRLVVVERAENDKYNHIQYKCICDCGNERVVAKASLVSNKTRSCGCYYKDTRKTCASTHGQSKTRLFHCWWSMIERCENHKYRDYKYYGGRGIKVCEEWKEFEEFAKWAYNNGYEDTLTIDRIDVNGNYEPTNCRWATRLTQANNTTRNRYIVHNGERKTISEWARITGKSQRTIYGRLKRGITDYEALFK